MTLTTLRTHRTRPGGCPRGWMRASFHSPLQRLVNQFVARGCRGVWKGARNARAVLPEGHHLSLAVVLSVAKPTETRIIPCRGNELAEGVVKVFNDANDLKDSRTRPGGCPRGWMRASFHSPLQRLVNQFVARGCRGVWKGARNARAVLPEGHHLSLAVVLSVAKPTETRIIPCRGNELAEGVVKVFNDANDLKDSRTRPGGCPRGWMRASFHSPLQLRAPPEN